MRYDPLMKKLSLSVLSALVFAACGGGVDSDEAAEAAYLGLDRMLGKSLALGFDGFNAASSANIPTQTTMGDITGTLTVSGQVDMGASDNKGMRLLLDVVAYRDEIPPDTTIVITYATADCVPANLDLNLRGIPDATLTGTLVGTFYMEGDIDGDVDLNLTITGMTEADPDVADNIRRVAGSTTVTGTATSGYGVYDVNVTL
jgi:hypothetical protein